MKELLTTYITDPAQRATLLEMPEYWHGVVNVEINDHIDLSEIELYPLLMNKHLSINHLSSLLRTEGLFTTYIKAHDQTVAVLSLPRYWKNLTKADNINTAGAWKAIKEDANDIDWPKLFSQLSDREHHCLLRCEKLLALIPRQYHMPMLLKPDSLLGGISDGTVEDIGTRKK
jgi:hypothetical protein